jgi:L-ascorbate metabolism protein UlaG (beta-lactamase superfamily)
MQIGDTVTVGVVQVTATPAVHDGRRSPWGPTATTLGFVVNGSRRVYFAGDTDLFPGMDALAGALDLALLPVWGWGPTLGPGHLNPRRAAEALQMLRPRLAVPIHWGTLAPFGLAWFRPRFLVEPPQVFAHHAHELAPQTRVVIVRPGHDLDW